jgi:cytochrome c553
MKPRIGTIVVGIACLALGAAIQRTYDIRQGTALQSARAELTPEKTPEAPKVAAPIWTPVAVERSKVDYSNQPMWAWGVTEPPKPDEKQAVQGDPNAPINNRLASMAPDELNRKRRAHGSKLEFSFAEIRNISTENPAGGGNVVDWFPDDHPTPMPEIISSGPAALGKNGRACGSCHLSDGSGRPENASPAGLPAGYIVRQLTDFKNDLRHSSDARKSNTNTMTMLAKAMTDEEMKQAAAYFSSVTWRPHVKVVETNLVPQTKIQGELFIPTGEEGAVEPIGNRIIEVPTDVEQNQVLRNSRGTWIAYVPVGSIKKGKDLVVNGGMKIVNDQIVQGKTTACGTCHGIDLLGVAPDVPPLAGRSPSYLARQIFDIQQGVRNGSNSNVTLMKMVVDKLTAEDIVNITAYLASRPVAAPAPSNQLLTRR